MSAKVHDPQASLPHDSIADAEARIVALERTIATQNDALDETIEGIRAIGEFTFGVPNTDLEEISQACTIRPQKTALSSFAQKC